jgi:hypothetical protein
VEILTGSFKTSLNGKLTPVKVTRHMMPQKGREHFNLTGFKWLHLTQGQIKIQNKTNYLNICLFVNIFQSLKKKTKKKLF